MQHWQGYRSRFLKSMFSLELSVVETTLIAVVFAMMGLHALIVAQMAEVGDAAQIHLVKMQAEQELMAASSAR